MVTDDDEQPFQRLRHTNDKEGGGQKQCLAQTSPPEH